MNDCLAINVAKNFILSLLSIERFSLYAATDKNESCEFTNTEK